MVSAACCGCCWYDSGGGDKLRLLLLMLMHCHGTQLSWTSLQQTLSRTPTKSANCFVDVDLKEGMNALAVQAGALRSKHHYAAPATGTEIAKPTSSSTRLSAVVPEGTSPCLVESAERRQGSVKINRPGWWEEEGAPGAGGEETGTAQCRAGPDGTASPFKARLRESTTLVGACGYTRRAGIRPLANCSTCTSS